MKARTANATFRTGVRLPDVAGIARRHGLSAIVFLGNFGLAKALAFVLPLAMAAVLPAATYASIEFALAAGLLLALLLTLGTPSAVAQLSLRRRPVPIADILALTIASTGAAMLVVALMAWAMEAPAIVLLMCAVTVISAVQGAGTAYCQTFSLRNCAAWISSIAIIAVGLAALSMAWLGATGIEAIAGILLAAGAVTVATAGLIYLRTAAPELAPRLVITWSTGRPMLLAAAISVWLGSSGRLLLGAFLPLEDVALYTFCFRVAAVALIAHQILTMSVFARIYTIRARAFDRLAAIYVLVIASILSLTAIAFVHVLPHVTLKSIPDRQMSAAMALYPIIALQVFYWMSFAVLEMRLNRVRRVRQGALWSALIAAGAAGVFGLLWWLGSLSLQLALVVLAAQMLGVNLAYLWVLARRGLVHAKVLAAILLGSMPLIVMGFLWA